jgi:hypothetical protein
LLSQRVPSGGPARFDNLHAHVEEPVGPARERLENPTSHELVGGPVHHPTQRRVDVLDQEIDDVPGLIPNRAGEEDAVGQVVDEGQVQLIGAGLRSFHPIRDGVLAFPGGGVAVFRTPTSRVRAHLTPAVCARPAY